MKLTPFFVCDYCDYSDGNSPHKPIGRNNKDGTYDVCQGTLRPALYVDDVKKLIQDENNRELENEGHETLAYLAGINFILKAVMGE